MDQVGLDPTRRFTIPCLPRGVQDVNNQDKPLKSWKSLSNLDTGETTQDKAEKQQAMTINVGGKVWHVPTQSALKYPNTRIGSLALHKDRTDKVFRLCDDYSVHKDEFFFDRDPALFPYIRHFYTSGVLWVYQEMCPMNFEEEVEYWGLSLTDTQLCCWLLFEEKIGDVHERLKVERDLLAETQMTYCDEHFRDMVLGNTRQMLWNFTDNPYSSPLAKAFSLFSNLCVLISIVAIALDTVEELQIHKTNGKTHMEWVEIVTIMFFMFEYFIRLSTTPDLKAFLKGGLNFVDLFAILPFIVQLIFETGLGYFGTRGYFKAMDQVGKFNQVLKGVKLLRVFCILKLARHSTGMRAFGFTLKQCSDEVCCIFLFIGLGIFTFSALLHSAERETEDSPITSIPYAWWWAAVSISTVGYGDVVPVTVLGRFVAFGCISFGIILNGMPISFLFNNFSDYYNKLKAQDYSTTSVERSLHLKKRFRRRCDFGCSPSEPHGPEGVANMT